MLRQLSLDLLGLLGLDDGLLDLDDRFELRLRLIASEFLLRSYLLERDFMPTLGLVFGSA